MSAATMMTKEFGELGLELYRFETTTRAKIACVSCPATCDTAINGSLPPEGLASNFRRKGWNDKHGKWTCPTCQAPRLKGRLTAERAKHPEPEVRRAPQTAIGLAIDRARNPEPAPAPPPQPPDRPMTQSKPPAPPSSPETPVDNRPDVREMLLVLGQLNLHFKNGLYAIGWSDKRIAEELGLPLAKVTHTREQSPHHGPIRGNRELDQIRSDLLSLREMVDQQIARVDGLATSIEQEA